MVKAGKLTLVTQSSKMIDCTEEAAVTTDTLSSPLCFQLRHARVSASATPDASSLLKAAKKARFKT